MHVILTHSVIGLNLKKYRSRETLRMEGTERLIKAAEQLNGVCFTVTVPRVLRQISTRVCFFMNQWWIMESQLQRTLCTHQLFTPVRARASCAEVKKLLCPHTERQVCCRPRWTFLQELRWCAWMCTLSRHYAIFYTEDEIVVTCNDKLSDSIQVLDVWV